MDLDEIEELLQEEWDYGGISVVCQDCGEEFFVEPDANYPCPSCGGKIRNPLIEAGLI
jgi:hypothetical protein